jgi:hypothetical protein
METGRPEAGSIASQTRPGVRIAPIPPTPPKPAAPVALIDQKPQAAPPEAQEPAQPYVFGGYEFESAAAAEHAFKSQDGRIRALALRLQEYEAALNRGPQPQPPSRPTVVEAPRQQGQPSAGAQPDGPWFENDALWERYKQLSVEHGPDYAGYLLARQMWENTERLVRETLDKRVGPIEVSAQVSQQYTETLGLVDEMANLADAQGSLVYPELASTEPRVLQEVVNLWKEMGGVRAGPRAWHMAVLEYRFRHGPPVTSQPAAPNNGQQGAPAPGGSAPAILSFGGQVPSPGPFPLAGGTGTPRGDAGPASPQDALFRGMTGAVVERKTPDGLSLGTFRR